MKLAGRKIMVTGGSAGIGLELTRQLIRDGATVLVVGRNGPKMEAALSSFGNHAIGMVADLSQPQEVDRLANILLAEHPDLSVLVNNAAIQHEMDFLVGDIGEMSVQARMEIATNLDAPVALTIRLLPILQCQADAAIVNISTALAIAPKKAAPVYCATKAGLRNFTRALRYQCEDDAPHIQVTDVIMTLVDTGMTAGRGSGKMSPKAAAGAIRRGILRNRKEVWVGKTSLLPLLMRISPGMVHCMLR